MTTKIISWNFYFKLDQIAVKNGQTLIQNLNPDIVCIQEHSEIKLIGFTKISIKLLRASVSIFFRTSKYKQIQYFRFGFDDAYNFYADNGAPNNQITRPIIILKLKDKVSNKNIIIGSIWAPHHIKLTHSNYTKKINEYINRIYESNDTIILCGDFNELYEHIQTNTLNFFNNGNNNNYEFKYIANGYTCCRALPGAVNTQYQATRKFDMFISNTQITNFQIISSYISDHLPISCSIDLNNPVNTSTNTSTNTSANTSANNPANKPVNTSTNISTNKVPNTSTNKPVKTSTSTSTNNTKTDVDRIIVFIFSLLVAAFYVIYTTETNKKKMEESIIEALVMFFFIIISYNFNGILMGGNSSYNDINNSIDLYSFFSTYIANNKFKKIPLDRIIEKLDEIYEPNINKIKNIFGTNHRISLFLDKIDLMTIATQIENKINSIILINSTINPINSTINPINPINQINPTKSKYYSKYYNYINNLPKTLNNSTKNKIINLINELIIIKEQLDYELNLFVIYYKIISKKNKDIIYPINGINEKTMKNIINDYKKLTHKKEIIKKSIKFNLI
jgi:endonuclease/exonuclease/phosphatase family metal-dependent hydrolase